MNVLQTCARSGTSVQKIFLNTAHWFHSPVLTLILHKSHIEQHCGCVSLVSQHSGPYFSRPASPHRLLLCAAPLIHNGMSHALKRPLSLECSFCVCACVDVKHPKIILPCLVIVRQATRLVIMVITIIFFKCNHRKNPPPGETHHWVFFSMGLCTTAVCVGAVRRAPALIKNK